MTRADLALALAMIAFPALADIPPSTIKPRMTLLPGSHNCFAWVEVDNRVGVYNRIETLHTQHGAVQFEYQTNGGHNPEDHDEAWVHALPDGVAAAPGHLVIPDGEKGYFCLEEFQGL